MNVIGKYFSLSEEQAGRFLQLEPLYKYWNDRINIISRRDIGNLYVHHVLHSLAIARIISFVPGTVIIDAGTGGGFPGIPLAILFPDSQFILTDSIRKKIHVVEAITTTLKLNNVTTRNIRLEELKENADFIVSRAVAEIPVLFTWVKKNILPRGNNAMKNGLLALKGGDLTAELRPMQPDVTIFQLKDLFTEPYFETKLLVHIPVKI